ncbi:MAG TPA: DUF2950 domain-containing protein [Candidatus Acidoferrum sp.]|jgi:hypothetical protein|nr:DUF2950 domain-containing protein [Candidatus Acidoferrum sp.]
MRRVKLNYGSANIWKLAAITVFVAGFCATGSLGQQQGQKTFSSPEEACKALYAAAQGNDEKALLELFGPDGKEIVNSGDADEDTRSRAHFVQRYDEMNRLVKEPDGTVTLYIGERNWPYPIPLVNTGNVWYFDTDAGKKEILYRRIGWNEASAIRICQELAAAQKEYYSKQNNEYAQKIFSDAGKHDGLYWKAGDGEPQSPIGPLVAWAVAQENADSRGGPPVPYRGYYFQILTKQGKNAAGGAKSYIVDGKMTQGFAFVAYPAEYRTSGVMTFLVGADGVVYEKDLGKKTETIAQSMKEYDPNNHWTKAEQDEQQAAEGETTK